MKKILILSINIFFSLVYASSIQEDREQRLEDTYKHYDNQEGTIVEGISKENITETNNGTLIIQNEHIYSNSSKDDISIKTGRKTHRIIIRNLKIRTNGNQANNMESTNSAVSIKSDKNTQIRMNNVEIDTNSENRIVSANREKVCAGALCIQSEKGNIDINNLNINNRNSNYTATSTHKNRGKVCAGALCIQSDNSDITIDNYSSKASGVNSYHSNK